MAGWRIMSMQRAQGGWDLTMASVAEEQTVRGGRPLLEHADELPGTQERGSQGIGDVGESEPVGGGANGEARAVDDHRTVDARSAAVPCRPSNSHLTTLRSLLLRS